jgi:hypothetical protein
MSPEDRIVNSHLGDFILKGVDRRFPVEKADLGDGVGTIYSTSILVREAEPAEMRLDLFKNEKAQLGCGACVLSGNKTYFEGSYLLSGNELIRVESYQNPDSKIPLDVFDAIVGQFCDQVRKLEERSYSYFG